MDREPDVEMAAAVRATELRFECKPEVRVVAYADTPAYAESVSERENLPDELDCDVSYRRFAIRWRAAAWLRDPDSIVRPTLVNRDRSADQRPGD